jgi:hypothetical protein
MKNRPWPESGCGRLFYAFKRVATEVVIALFFPVFRKIFQFLGKRKKP